MEKLKRMQDVLWKRQGASPPAEGPTDVPQKPSALLSQRTAPPGGSRRTAQPGGSRRTAGIGFTSLVMAWASLVPACIGQTLAIDPSVATAQQQRIDVMRSASEATIAVFGPDGGGGGSGVIITPDGFALTNYHVSSACGDHMRCGLDDGNVYDAVIVGIDATGDVSLIQLLGRSDFPTAPLGDSNALRVGQWCFAAGNPFVLATNLQPSISMGIISGLNRYQYPAGTLLEYADCIQTDAAINPGNSGGPLFNLAGQVIGINGRCSFEKRGRVNVGVGYAISANQLRYFIGMLESGRLIDHATLGATVSTDDSGRVLVSNILSSSDAYRRGLRFGDELLSLADREVRTTNTFKNVLGTLPKDWRVPLTLRREGDVRTLLVRLDGVHTDAELAQLVSAELQPGHDNLPPDGRSPDDAEENTPPPSEPAPAETDTDDAQPSQLVQSMIESRAGFANNYFNRKWKNEIWQKTLTHGDYPATSAAWHLSGTLAGETTPAECFISDATGKLQVGSRTVDVDFAESMADVVSARRESGMLIALKAMQQYLRKGPDLLGDTIYLGRLPVYPTQNITLADQTLHQVLQSLWYDAKVRLHFDPASGDISLVEVFGDLGQDPVEMYVDQYEEVRLGGSGEQVVRFPMRLRLQYGVEPVLLLQLDSIQLRAAEPEPSRDARRAEELQR